MIGSRQSFNRSPLTTPHKPTIFFDNYTFTKSTESTASFFTAGINFVLIYSSFRFLATGDKALHTAALSSGSGEAINLRSMGSKISLK
jgi:hypothetical protein